MATNETPRKGSRENPWVVQCRNNRPNVSSSERPPRELVYTSQGRPQDKPPENWVRPELIAFNVITSAPLIAPDLTGIPHAIFARERWPQLRDERFKALEQTFLLASKLLELGMPYLASFLPPPNVTRANDLREVSIRKDPSIEDIRAASKEFNEIAEDSVLWKEDRSILRQHGVWSTRSLAPRNLQNSFTLGEDRPDREADSYWKESGWKRRDISVFIASQYIDILLSTDSSSDQHLRTTFHAALTMVREIAHLVWWQNLSHKTTEPFVNDQCERGLGMAFTSWIFGGWNPEPVDEKEGFKLGMYWKKQLSGDIERPTWRMKYSIDMDYIQALMSQSTWDQLPGEMFTSERTKAFHKPQAPFINGSCARVALCDKAFSRGRWRWKVPAGTNARTRFRHPRLDLEYPPELPTFMDHNWTLDASRDSESGDSTQETVAPSLSGTQHNNTSEAAGAQSRVQGSSPQMTRPVVPENVTTRITVTYSGEFDEVAQQIHARTNPRKRQSGDTGEEIARQSPAKKNKRSQWPEGLLRGECSRRDISTFGSKQELIDRLDASDALHNARSGRGNEGEPQQGEGNASSASSPSSSLSDDDTPFTLDLNLSTTTLGELSSGIYKITGIEPRFQMLMFGSSGLETLVRPGDDAREPRQKMGLGSRFATELSLTHEVLLYRILLPPRPDLATRAALGS